MPRTIGNWFTLIDSLFQPPDGDGYQVKVHGPCLAQWMEFVQADWDDVDAIYMDHETMGC